MSQILPPREKRQITLQEQSTSPADLPDKLFSLYGTLTGIQANIYCADKNDSDHFVNEDNNAFLDELGQEISRILYIEDNPSNLRLVQSILEKFPDIELVSTATAESGLKLAKENHFDLILLDIFLPGMNGYEALQQLQNHNKTKDITVMAVSAAAAPHDIEKGLLAGFKRYITKPINVDEFISALNLELNFKEE